MEGAGGGGWGGGGGQITLMLFPRIIFQWLTLVRAEVSELQKY